MKVLSTLMIFVKKSYYVSTVGPLPDFTCNFKLKKREGQQPDKTLLRISITLLFVPSIANARNTSNNAHHPMREKKKTALPLNQAEPWDGSSADLCRAI